MLSPKIIPSLVENSLPWVLGLKLAASLTVGTGHRCSGWMRKREWV